MTFPSCVGCGYCCWRVPCAMGVEIHGLHAGPCKSLVWKDGRHWCGEVLDCRGLAGSLHIGAGCTSSLNTWRREPLRDRTKEDTR